LAEIRYLSADDVVILQAEAVRRSGAAASPLIRPDTLESALARPRNAAGYEGADLIRQATLLAVGVSQAQAFLDGNKRAAFAAADVFLRVNGHAFAGDPMEIARRLEQVAEAVGGTDRDEATDRLEAWLRDHVGPVDG